MVYVKAPGKNWFACCEHCHCKEGRKNGHPDKCDKGCDALTGAARVR
jgi:hypothetical protein